MPSTAEGASRDRQTLLRGPAAAAIANPQVEEQTGSYRKLKESASAATTLGAGGTTASRSAPATSGGIGDGGLPRVHSLPTLIPARGTAAASPPLPRSGSDGGADLGGA